MILALWEGGGLKYVEHLAHILSNTQHYHIALVLSDFVYVFI